MPCAKYQATENENGHMTIHTLPRAGRGVGKSAQLHSVGKYTGKMGAGECEQINMSGTCDL